MKTLTISLMIAVVLLSCSGEESNHKTLFYTFSDQGLPAMATTGIEPETKAIVALHLSHDPDDVAFDPASGNVYLSMGQNAEILVYKIDDVSNGKILFETQSGVGAIAIDTHHQKLYWVSRNQGKVYVHNLDGTGNSSVLFGDASLAGNCTGLAIDPGKNRMYLLDEEMNKILMADLNTGSDPSELVTTSTFNMEGPHDLEISEDGNTLYWVDANRIIETDTGTGACSVFRSSTATHLFLHHTTNFLYVSFSRDVSKTEIGGDPTFQRVFQDEGPISHVLVR